MKTIDLQGNRVEADDPTRGVWYSSCGYWTDDWDKLRHVGPGIPVCPTCGRPGFQTTYGEWDSGVEEYNLLPGNGGYAEFIAKSKEKCFSDRIGVATAWPDYQKGLLKL